MQPADTTSSAEIKNDPLDPIFDVDHDSGLRIGCYHRDFSSFCITLQSVSPPLAGMLHARVGQTVLKCNDFKTLLSEGPFFGLRAGITFLFGRGTPLFSVSYGMQT